MHCVCICVRNDALYLVLDHHPIMPARRISYVIPAPQDPPPLLSLPPIGVPRHGQTAPLLIPVAEPTDSREPPRSTPRPSHPQHRLAVSALALDTSTQLVDRSTPEGILYTSGRDGLVAAWELGVTMRRRVPRGRERRRHWEALTGWDEADDESDEEEEDGLDGIVRPPRQKRVKPPVDESGWAYEDRWEAASDELKPAQFRQSVQLHTDWINDIVLCNLNQTSTPSSNICDRLGHLTHQQSSLHLPMAL
jgi:WD repeat-containing protein 48